MSTVPNNPTMLRSLGATVSNTRILNHLSMGIVNLTPKQIEQLESENCMTCVARDRKVHALLDKASNTIGSKLRAYDDNGHGTHVAGIIAGDGLCSQRKYVGIAPKCRVVGVKVLNSRGSGMISHVLMGLDWCIKNKAKYGIRIINLSLGSPSHSSHAVDPLCLAVQRVEEAGILVVSAAGNSGPMPQSIESPGCCPSTLTVGAVDDREADTPQDSTIAGFSSRGPTFDNLAKPDICAPGVSITAARSRHIYPRRLRNLKLYSYVSQSGTSMAAPMVAGTAALLLQASPKLTIAELRSKLQSSTIKLQATEADQGQGLIVIRQG